MADAAGIQDLIDYTAIRRLQDAYADIVTRRAWAELKDVFVPDLRLDLDLRSMPARVMTGPEEIGGFIGGSLEKFEFFEFVILNTRIYLRDGGDETQALGRMFMSEIRQERTSGAFSTIYGVYHDRFRRIDGRWWFAARQYHSLARPPAEPGRDMDVFGFPPAASFPAAIQ